MDIRTWDCPSCDDVRDFVQPGCADGHAADRGECPEWACSECGCGLFAGIAARLPAYVEEPDRLAA
jgi:hypothetical protein